MDELKKLIEQFLIVWGGDLLKCEQEDFKSELMDLLEKVTMEQLTKCMISPHIEWKPIITELNDILNNLK